MDSGGPSWPGRAEEICTKVAARERARWKHIDHGFEESVASSLLILMREKERA